MATRIFSDLAPFDEVLAASKMMRRLTRTTIAKLMDEGLKNTCTNFNMTFLEAQILRVICPSADSRASINYRGQRNKGSMQMNYHRLFLLRQHGPEESNTVFYVMMSRDQNGEMFNRNIAFRDNGVISIGSYIRILAPMPIVSLMNNVTPMIVSNFPIVALKPPLYLEPIAASEAIQGDNSYAFINSNAHLHVNSTAPFQTNCSGLLCDKQRLREIRGGCGCFHMISNRSNIAFLHHIRIVGDLGLDITIENFSSTKFSLLFLSERLPPSIRISALTMSDAFFDMMESVEKCIEIINNDGGFTIVGWYRRGFINDRSLDNEAENRIHNQNNNNDLQIGSSNMMFHVVEITPSNKDFLNTSTRRGATLQQEKFDVSKFGQI